MKNLRENYFKELGAYLREKRKECGLDQLSVSLECGLVTAQLLSNIERGICAIPDKMLVKLVHIYNLKPSDVVKVWAKAHENRYRSVLETRVN